jgi:hypothetical protein
MSWSGSTVTTTATDRLPSASPSGARGISTVLDVTLFLLLVSAAALSLATAGVDQGGDPAAADGDAATVETLGTATATVHYDLGVESRTGASITRVRHGTLAELLAEAAVASVAVDGVVISPYADGFTGAVADAVSPTLDGRTQVVATWAPYPGSRLRGRVAVGPAPPPDATVHAATLTIDSGVPPARTPALDASDRGYDGVADVVAERVVDGLFPSRRLRVALDGGGVDGSVARAGFERTASSYGSETTLDAGVTPATRDLTAAVANRTRTDLRARFETPRAAASSVRTDRVTVVVRTWS